MNASWKFTNGFLGFVVLLLVSVRRRALRNPRQTLAGTVTDPTGAVVPNASVKVRSLATNVIREDGKRHGRQLCSAVAAAGRL